MDSLGNVLRSYTWGAAGLVSDTGPTDEGIRPRFYFFDALGNTRHLRKADGTVWQAAYWNPWGSTGFHPDTPFGWSGKNGIYRDSETGLHYIQQRYYHSSIARFLARDPIGFDGGINIYAYCSGDPINYFDRTGADMESVRNWFGGAFRGLLHAGADLADGLSVVSPGAHLFTEAYKVNGGPGPFADFVRNRWPAEFKSEAAYNGYKEATSLVPVAMMYLSSAGASVPTMPARSAAVPGAAATRANFATYRGALRRAMGNAPFQGAEAHHGLVWKHKDWFAAPPRNLNVSDPRFGRWVDGPTHRRWSYEFEVAWDIFIEAFPNASARKVLSHLRRLENSGRFP